jgi:hypothetical protein
LPSSAGIGVKFGCSESSSAAVAAFDLPAPELGLAGAEDDVAGADVGAELEELTGGVPASDSLLAAAESVAAAGVFPVVSLAEEVLAVALVAALAEPSAARGLVSSANPAATIKNIATTRIAARSSTFKVRLLTTAQPTSFRAADGAQSFPPASGALKKPQDSKGAVSGSIERVLPVPVKLAGL